jgi:hypothetical protein
MKTRNGFVSNSSSTSFVIAYKNGEPCPHCGRSDPDWADFFKEKSETFSDATYLEHRNADEIIHDNLENINRNNLEIDNLNLRDADGPAFSRPEYTVSNYQDTLEKENKEYESLIEKVKKSDNEGWTVIKVQVSYHDNETKEIVDNAQDNGTVRILEKTCD